MPVQLVTAHWPTSAFANNANRGQQEGGTKNEANDVGREENCARYLDAVASNSLPLNPRARGGHIMCFSNCYCSRRKDGAQHDSRGRNLLVRVRSRCGALLLCRGEERNCPVGYFSRYCDLLSSGRLLWHSRHHRYDKL